MGDTPGVEILQCIKYTFFKKNQHLLNHGAKNTETSVEAFSDRSSGVRA